MLPAFLIYAAKNELTQIILHINHLPWDVKTPPILYLRLLHSWKNLCLRNLDVFLIIKFHSRDNRKCFIWNNFPRGNLTEHLFRLSTSIHSVQKSLFLSIAKCVKGEAPVRRVICPSTIHHPFCTSFHIECFPSITHLHNNQKTTTA